MPSGKPLVMIAGDVRVRRLLATLVVNKVKGIFRSAAVKAPSVYDR